MSKKNNQQESKGFLGAVERIGNALPHPAMIFVILTIILLVVAEIVARTGQSVEFINASTGETELVSAVSLLNPEGIRYMFNNAVKNFVNFAPLGVILVAMLGVGVSENSGMLGNLFKKMLLGVNPKFLTATVVFVGIISNIAADAGYVVVIPIGALLFAKAGRHPIAGLAAAFAGVSGGFSANLIFGPNDAQLSGITNEALKVANIPIEITTPANWYFLLASTVLLVIVGTLVTEKIVIPNLGEYHGSFAPDKEEVTDLENKGLRNAGIATLIYLAIMGFLMFPQNAILKEFNEATQAVDIHTFLSSGLILGIFFLFLIPGFVYGKTVGTIKDSNDLVSSMAKAMEGMADFLVLAFFASQFVAYFGVTNLGTILSVNGANALKAIGLTGIPLITLFIFLAAFLNLFIGSASAKWAIMAPIFVPMLAELGISPALTQIAYRIGDSTTNIITPLMVYFPMIVVFMKRYDKESGIGTLVSTMLPYSLAFLITWAIFLVLWMLIGLPLGPNTPLFI